LKPNAAEAGFNYKYPIVNAGFRHGLSPWREEQVKSLQFSFMKAMNTNKTDVFGINLEIR
jgi:hypothetical protein